MFLHNAVLVAIVAIGVAALVWVYRRDQRRLKAQRGRLFASCLALLEDPRQRQDDLGYPILTGRYRGQRFHIDAVIDHIAVRKVPSLWLRVSLFADLPHLATLDILMRAQNVEFYSPSNDLPHRVDVPAGWPAEAVIHTDDPARMPPPGVIAPHLDFFRQPQAKEMLVTPKGLRLVYQASQADKLHYQVLRQANFAAPELAPELLRQLLDRLVALRAAIEAAAPAVAATDGVDLGADPRPV
jgi:hypothetical protein